MQQEGRGAYESDITKASIRGFDMALVAGPRLFLYKSRGNQEERMVDAERMSMWVALCGILF